MFINNTDALKVWLTEVLEPLCDADPAALARYVLALLKKDKPEKDLLVSMKEQLDVFLSEETQPFLEQLFRVIKSEEYLKAVPAPPLPVLPASNGSSAVVASASSASSTTTTTAGATASTTEEHVSSSSRGRGKREFTPPLQDTSSRLQSKESAGAAAQSERSSDHGKDHHHHHSSSASAVTGAASSAGHSGSGTVSSIASHSQQSVSSSSASSSSVSHKPSHHSPIKGSSKEDHVSEPPFFLPTTITISPPIVPTDRSLVYIASKFITHRPRRRALVLGAQRAYK